MDELKKTDHLMSVQLMDGVINWNINTMCIMLTIMYECI